MRPDTIVGRVLRHILPLKLSSLLVEQRPTGFDQAAWDRQYAAGGWEFLNSLTEMPRYSVVAGYCRAISPTGSVLDVGCGVGLLYGWLCSGSGRRYVGIDIAEAAIQQARKGVPADCNVRFEVSDALGFIPGEQFDIIVLNEVLYYIEKPEALLSSYEAFLNPSGMFVVSMYNSAESLQTWRRCAPRLEVLDEVELARVHGYGWTIRLCRPRSGDPAGEARSASKGAR